MPFIFSGVCSPSEGDYCSNTFEVLTIRFRKYFAINHLLNDKNLKTAKITYALINGCTFGSTLYTLLQQNMYLLGECKGQFIFHFSF